jgi:hypothetical protein
MEKSFKCAACRKSADGLYQRYTDGKWVCASCLPKAQIDAYPGFRERAKLKTTSKDLPRRKAA